MMVETSLVDAGRYLFLEVLANDLSMSDSVLVGWFEEVASESVRCMITTGAFGFHILQRGHSPSSR